jgi:hypothetical protein
MSHQDQSLLRPEQLRAEFLTRDQLAVYLSMVGFPITISTLDKLCAPAIGDGPPVAKYWGRRPLYDLEQCLAWARARLSSSPRPTPHNVKPSKASRKRAS